MEKYIYDENTGLHYELIGDYYYPCLTAPEPARVGAWGMRRHKYLREYKRVMYTGMLLADKLNPHLEEVDRHAEEMFFRLMEQFKEAEGITEQLKVSNQMEWVQRMNSISNRVVEIINKELIFV